MISYDASTWHRYHGGDGFSVTTSNWLYCGTSFTASETNDYEVYGVREWNSGIPFGIALSVNNYEYSKSNIVSAFTCDPEIYSKISCSTIVRLYSGDVIALLSKAAIGICSEYMLIRRILQV